MVGPAWMETPALSIILILLLASLDQTRAGAGPFSWGSRINFSKVAKEKAPVEGFPQGHYAPQVDWEGEDGSKESKYKGRYPRQTARFQPGSARPDMEMLMVMREIERSIMDSITNRALPFQGLQTAGETGRRVGGADFRRAFTTLGRL